MIVGSFMEFYWSGLHDRPLCSFIGLITIKGHFDIISFTIDYNVRIFYGSLDLIVWVYFQYWFKQFIDTKYYQKAVIGECSNDLMKLMMWYFSNFVIFSFGIQNENVKDSFIMAFDWKVKVLIMKWSHHCGKKMIVNFY